MLSYMRKNAKSPVIKVLLVGVALSFIIGFGASYFLKSVRKAGTQHIDSVAKVADVDISRRQYIEQVEQAKRRYRAQGFGEDQEIFKSPFFMRSVLNNLIDMVVIRLAAQDMGIEISNEEVANYLRRSGMFVSKGKFNRQRMLNFLRRSGQSLEDFENNIRFELAGYKLLNLLQSSIFASEDEVWKEYQAKNEKVALRVIRMDKKAVPFDPASLGDDEMKKAYDESPEDFRRPEKRRLNYVAFDVNDYIEDVDLSDQDIRSYYDNNQDHYRAPEMARYRQIIMRFADGAKEKAQAKVKEKIESIRKQIVEQGADFAELAKKYSEDETTSESGGDAGWQAKSGGISGIKNKAFAMSKGDVSEVIDIPGGVALIKLEGRREAGTRPFDEVKERVELEAMHNAARQLAGKDIAAAYSEITPGTDLVEFAEKKGYETSATPFFTDSGDAKGIEKGFEVAKSAFTMTLNEIAGPHEGYSHWYIYQLIEIEESAIPPFEEIEDEVRMSVASKRVEELLTKMADDYLSKLGAGEMTLDQIAEELGLEIIDTGKFSASVYSVPKLGYVNGLVEEAFGVFPPDKYPKQAVENSGERIIFEVAGRDIADQKAFEAEKNKLQNEFMKQKYMGFMTQWIQGLRERYPVVENQEFWSKIAQDQ